MYKPPKEKKTLPIIILNHLHTLFEMQSKDQSITFSASVKKKFDSLAHIIYSGIKRCQLGLL